MLQIMFTTIFRVKRFQNNFTFSKYKKKKKNSEKIQYFTEPVITGQVISSDLRVDSCMYSDTQVRNR